MSKGWGKWGEEESSSGDQEKGKKRIKEAQNKGWISAGPH